MELVLVAGKGWVVVGEEEKEEEEARRRREEGWELGRD